MRTIQRSPAPPRCLRNQPRDQDWQTFMRSDCHSELRGSLRTEQHHLCCYCEDELCSKNSHIEHMEPRSFRRGDDYDYGNLAASCNGGTQGNHCGRFKDDRHRNPHHRHDPDLFSPPHDSTTAALFQYLLNGKLLPAADLLADDARRAAYMIDHLGLNSPSLVNSRRCHAREIVDTLTGTPEPETVSWMLHDYLESNSEGRLHKFVSLSRSLLAR